MRAAPFALALFPALSAFSHPTGTSKIDAVLRPGFLEMRVDVNSYEVLKVLGVYRTRDLSRAEMEALSGRIADYYRARLKVSADGRPAGPVQVVFWSKDTLHAARKMDSAALEDTTYVMKLAWPLPSGARRLILQSDLFAEFEVQAICQLSLYQQNRLIMRRWLALDDQFPVELDTASLRALSGNQAKPARNSPASTWGILKRFVFLGFTHIVPHGPDHILFVLGLFLFSTFLRPLFIQVTAFTLAHSITLGLSMLGVLSLPTRIVEPLIALSIAVVALENIFFRKLRPSRWMIVFTFGLVHGLGFAGVLKGLGLVQTQFLATLVGFNAGVELGQLTVIAGAAVLTAWMWKRPWYFHRVVMPASGLIAAVGLFWAVQRLMAP
jgi:hypothetical protein